MFCPGTQGHRTTSFSELPSPGCPLQPHKVTVHRLSQGCPLKAVFSVALQGLASQGCAYTRSPYNLSHRAVLFRLSSPGCPLQAHKVTIQLLSQSCPLQDVLFIPTRSPFNVSHRLSSPGTQGHRAKSLIGLSYPGCPLQTHEVTVQLPLQAVLSRNTRPAYNFSHRAILSRLFSLGTQNHRTTSLTGLSSPGCPLQAHKVIVQSFCHGCHPWQRSPCKKKKKKKKKKKPSSYGPVLCPHFSLLKRWACLVCRVLFGAPEPKQGGLLCPPLTRQ